MSKEGSSIAWLQSWEILIWQWHPLKDPASATHLEMSERTMEPEQHSFSFHLSCPGHVLHIRFECFRNIITLNNNISRAKARPSPSPTVSSPTWMSLSKLPCHMLFSVGLPALTSCTLKSLTRKRSIAVLLPRKKHRGSGKEQSTCKKQNGTNKYPDLFEFLP